MKKEKAEENLFRAIHKKNSMQNRINTVDISFATGELPSMISAIDSDISISKRHYANQNSSLRWDCKQGSQLCIAYQADDLSPTSEVVTLPSGVPYTMDGNVKGFSMYVYSEEKTDHRFCVRFYQQGKAMAEFPFLTNFIGWREVSVPFNADMMRCAQMDGFDQVVITAQSGASTIYIDRLSPCVDFDVRSTSAKSHLPMNKYSPGRRLDNFKNRETDSKNIPFRAEVTPATDAEVALLTQHYLKYAKQMDLGTQRSMQEVLEALEAFSIKEVEGCVTGTMLGTQESGKLNKICSDLAFLYLGETDASKKEEIERYALLAIRHSVDQCYRVAWYNGRGLATAALVFKEALVQGGYFDLVFDFLWAGYRLQRMYDTTTNHGFHQAGSEDTDTIGTCMSSYIAIFLLRDNRQEMARDFIYLKEYIETRVLQPCAYLNGYLPDGTAAHHATFLLEYHQTANNGMANVFWLLSQTRFAISKEGYRFFKNILRVESIWRSGYHQPLALAHKQLSTKPGLRSDYVGKFALACEDGIDQAVAQQYLAYAQYDPQEQSGEIYREVSALSLAAQQPTEGHVTLSFSAAAAHKSGEMTAYVKGHSKYSYVMETWYTQVCAFPYYRSFGVLEFCKPSSRLVPEADNGMQLDAGFDWRHYPGTTTVKVPFEKLKACVLRIGGEFNETLRSDQEFVGGVDDGKNGVFAMKLRGHSKYGIADFFATKTYFFYDGMVVCLGSDIEKFADDGVVTTTILQTVTAEDTLEQGENYLLDSRNIGYYLPQESMRKLVAGVQVQHTPNSGDLAIAEGKYALAYLSHGNTPYQENYQYSVHLDVSAEKMEALAANLQSDAPCYQVLQQDKFAHVVHFVQGLTMMAIFEKNYALNHAVVLGVNCGCLLMVDQSKSSETVISIADPDLRFYEGEADDKDYLSRRRDMSNYEHQWRTNASIPSTIYLQLKGKITQIESVKGSFEILHQTEEYTVVKTICQNGVTNQMKLL